MALTEGSKRCFMPNTSITLFPHQEAMLAKVAQIEQEVTGWNACGVMKDPPGSGKSFVMLAMILAEKRASGRTQNLLVIPENLCKQWADYIQRYSPELTWRTFTQYGDITALYYKADILHQYDILITTSAYYMTIAQTMQHMNLTVNRVMLDEIDSISFFMQTLVPTRFVWLISASVDLTKEGIFQSAVSSAAFVQCDPNFIAKSIQLPAPIIKSYKCTDTQLALLTQLNIDRDAINAMDFSQVKFDYLANAVITNTKSLVTAILKNELLHIESMDGRIAKLEADLVTLVSLERRISNLKKRDGSNGGNDVEDAEDADDNFRHLNDDERIKAGNEAQAHVENILRDEETLDKWNHRNHLINERKLLQNKVDMIIDRVHETSCPVCLEDFSEEVKKVVVRCCENVFCLDCLKEHLRRSNKCAKCRQPVNEQMLIVTDKGVEEEQKPDVRNFMETKPVTSPSMVAGKSKIECLDDILTNETQASQSHRFLIFSDFAGSFAEIRKLLDRRGDLSYAEIEGTSKSMEQIVQGYQTGQTKILLIDSLHYGAGLNLPMTDSVILIHKTERREQILGRAQRIGRNGALKVHELLYADE